MSPDALELPESLRRVLPAARWERVNHGESSAEVWRSTRFVVKVQPHESRGVTSLQQERGHLRWLAPRLPVPGVVGYEVADNREYLAMTRLRGIPLSDPDALLHPERVVTLLARALRELHALPLRDCPFTMTLNVTLRLARERVQAGVVDETDFDEQRRGSSAISIFNELVRTRPAAEDLVVTHGDPCLPNLLVNGELLEGLVDVGRLGIADRHADIALAHRSVRRNLNDFYAGMFLDLYGRQLVNPGKIEYFNLLDELF